MSHRRKHVQALAHEREVTLRRDVDVVCVVTDTLGSNLLEVRKGTNDDDGVGEDGTTTVIRVPAKFKNLVYFRSGMYVVATFVGRDELEGSDAKVTGELVRVLYADQVKELKKREDGSWPASFEDAGGGGDGGVGCPLGDLVDALREDEADGCRSERAGQRRRRRERRRRRR
jgi:probable RNA-binding protein EIF1AD